MTNDSMGKMRGFRWRHAIVAALLAACGGVTSTPTVGGESHFLRDCDGGCGSGLECVSGVCTRSCLMGKDSCTDLADGAMCTDASIEPGAVAVCDLACDSARDCGKLGSDFDCEAGFCRGPLPHTTPGGTGGATSPGGSGGIGNTGQAGEGPTPGWKPPQLCSLPFEGGGCLAYQPVYAAVNGQCQPEVYGGCGGNENRFRTLEECLSTCQGAPSATACPAGRVSSKICIECGLAGGCAAYDEYCAKPCETPTDCEDRGFSGLTCFEGICQAYGCD